MDTYTVTYRDAGRGERQAESFATLAEAEAYAAETRDMFERTGHAWLAPGVSIIVSSAEGAGNTDTDADFISPYLHVCETCLATGAYRREGIPAISSGEFPCDGCKGTDGQTVTRATLSA